MRPSRWGGNSADLLLAAFITLAFLGTLALDSPWRFPVGAAFVLWVPGYALLSVLFPVRARGDPAKPSTDALWSSAVQATAALNGIERAVLAMAVSIVLGVVAGLLAQLADPASGMQGPLRAMAAFSLACLVVGHARRKHVVVRRERWLISGAAGLVLLGTSAAMLGAWASEPGTEFYLETRSGLAFGPKDVRQAGEPQTFRIVVVHHDEKPASYVIEIARIDDNASGQVETVVSQWQTPSLGPGARHVQEANYTLESNALRSEIRLLRVDGSPFRSLELRHDLATAART